MRRRHTLLRAGMASTRISQIFHEVRMNLMLGLKIILSGSLQCEKREQGCLQEFSGQAAWKRETSVGYILCWGVTRKTITSPDASPLSS